MTSEDPTLTEDNVEIDIPESVRIIRDKLIHVLTIYPQVSPTMLQIGVGTSLPPNVWKPILYQMIAEGVILKEEKHALTPSDRYQVYTVLQLNAGHEQYPSWMQRIKTT